MVTQTLGFHFGLSVLIKDGRKLQNPRWWPSAILKISVSIIMLKIAINFTFRDLKSNTYNEKHDTTSLVPVYCSKSKMATGKVGGIGLKT